MQDLSSQRCFNHAAREAVARCPECRRCFCRECVTEHEDRMVCAACLAKLARRPLTARAGWAGLGRLGLCVFSLLAGWFFFFLIGEGLLALPDSFHEGTVWQVPWTDQ